MGRELGDGRQLLWPGTYRGAGPRGEAQYRQRQQLGKGHTLARSHDSRFGGAQTKAPAPGLRAGEQQDAPRLGHPSTRSGYEGQRNLF